MPQRIVPPRNRGFAKSMRAAMPEAELRLWIHLRKPGNAALRFRRQVPIGPYIVDFFCPRQRLIVEVDGGQHASPQAVRYDRQRDAWLQAQGYRVLRISTWDVMTNMNGVYRAILALGSYDV